MDNEKPTHGIQQRNTAKARVWTTHTEPVPPADIADDLVGRGFTPGVTADEPADAPTLSVAGLGDARFTVGGAGLHFSSLSSSRGDGCRVRVLESSKDDLPDDYLARRAVPRPRLVYLIEAGGPGNSDRALCEHIAELLMEMTNGVVEIAGLGVKGNRPTLYNSRWLGSIRV